MSARRRAAEHPTSPVVLLEFSIEAQRHMNWCWAAVGASVARYYGAPKMTQCEVANRTLGRDTCCSGDPECVKTWYISNTLRDLDVFESGTEDPLLSYDEVRAELVKGRPLVCDVEWFGGGRHVVVVVGCIDDGRVLVVHDPADGAVHHVAYDAFRSNYRGMGAWRAYLKTRPPAARETPRPLQLQSAPAVAKDERHIFAATLDDILQERVLANAKEISRGDDPTRVLRIPAVYVEALWLDDDVLVPLPPAPPPLYAHNGVSERAFTNALLPLARQRASLNAGEV